MFGKKQYTKLSDVSYLLQMVVEGHWRGQANEEHVKRQFEEILGMSISDLHDARKHPFPLNPYMIGITYVHRFIRVHQETKTNEPMLRRVTFPHWKIEFDDILKDWKMTDLAAGPLTGIVFISDRVVIRTHWIDKLMLYKAFPIGRETSLAKNSDKDTGASFFVANKMAVFALNHGIYPRIKENAEYHQLFTLSIALTIDGDEICTITTRTFSDLKSVGNVMSPRGTAVLDKRAGVTVVLGYSDYYTDKVLYELGRRLPGNGYYVDFHFNEDRFDYPEIDDMMKNEESWRNKYDSRVARQKFDADRRYIEKSNNSKTSLAWSFILSSKNCVTHLLVSDMAIQPVHITIPLNITMGKRNNPEEEKQNEPESASESTSVAILREKPQDESRSRSPTTLKGTSKGISEGKSTHQQCEKFEEDGVEGQRTATRDDPSTEEPKDVSEDRSRSEIESKRRSWNTLGNKIHPENQPESNLRSNSVPKYIKPESKSDSNAISESTNQFNNLSINMPRRKLERSLMSRSLKSESRYRPVEPTTQLGSGLDIGQSEKNENNTWKKWKTWRSQKSSLKPGAGLQGHSGQRTVERKRSIQIIRRNDDKLELLDFAELIIQLLGALDEVS